MTTKSKSGKASLKRYSPEFKAEALALAEQVGVGEAAKQLGLHPAADNDADIFAVMTGDDGPALSLRVTTTAENAAQRRRVLDKIQSSRQWSGKGFVARGR